MSGWTWPTVCKAISQGYGVKNARYVRGYHTGIDIACANGSPIRSATDGTVSFAGWAGAYGNQVKVAYNANTEIWYNHMQRLNIGKGDKVSAGQVIGWEGTTGNSTGPHLHFEVRINGKDVDPSPYLDGSKVITAGDTVASPVMGWSDIKSLVSFLNMVKDGDTWIRLMMIVGGSVLMLMAIVGVARAKVLGSLAGDKVTKVVKSVGKSGSAGTGQSGTGTGSQ